MRSSHYLILALFLFLFVSRLVQEGMFVDGVGYAAIANNLAHGTGSFWAPHFSEIMFPGFYEHPSLMFGLESVFFKVLGDGYGTERIYCLSILVLTMVLIVRIWLSFFRGTDLEDWWPLPLFFWMLNPDAYLSYTANLPECTMTVFDLLAVLILLMKWPVNNEEGSKKPAWMFIAGAGLALLAAFFTKGVGGLYPVLFFAIYRSGKKLSAGAVIRYTLALATLFGLAISVFFLFDAPALALKSFFQEQIAATVPGSPTGNNTLPRLYTGLRLFQTQTHWLVIGGLLWYFLINSKNRTLMIISRKPVLVAGLTGIAALLPVLFISHQASCHIVPVLPWVSLALGAWYGGILGQLSFQKISSPVVLIAAIVVMLAAAGWVMFKTGKILPDSEEAMNDVRELMRIVPKGSPVAYIDTNPSLVLWSYLQRYNYSDVDHEIKDYKYIIIPKNFASADALPVYFKLLPLETKRFDLCMRR